MQSYISKYEVPIRLRFDQEPTVRAKNFQNFCRTNNIKLLFAPIDDHRTIGVVGRMIQTLKSRLAVIKIDQLNTPYKLDSDVAEIIITMRITPHSITKISSFEAQMGKKPNTPLSNIATSSSPNNLNWESAKYAFLDQKKPYEAAITSENHAQSSTLVGGRSDNYLINSYQGLFKTLNPPHNKTQVEILNS